MDRESAQKESAKVVIKQAINIALYDYNNENRLNRLECYIDQIQLRGRYWFGEPIVVRKFDVIPTKYLRWAIEELEQEYNLPRLRFIPYERVILIDYSTKD